MKGQNVNPLDISQVRSQRGQPINLGRVIGPTWHKHEANPDRSLQRGQPLGKGMDGLIVLAGQSSVQVGRDGFEIQEYQVNGGQIIVTQSLTQIPISIQGSVNA